MAALWSQILVLLPYSTMNNSLFICLPRNTHLQMARTPKSAPDPTFYTANSSTGLAQTAEMKTNPDITPDPYY